MTRLLLALPFVLMPTASAQPPVADKKPVADTIHGVEVAEDYRWLETAADPAVKAWYDGQSKHARAALDAIRARGLIRDRLRELLAAPSTGYSGLQFAGGKLFALKSEPPREQPFLVVMDASADPKTAKVLLDPNVLDAKGKTTIDFYAPSPDGALVAVSLSENGSEAGTLHLFEVATGKKRDDVLPRVIFPTAGGDVAWAADGRSLYYTRFPAPGERPTPDLHFYQQVYRHTIGQPVEKDEYVFGKDSPRIAETNLQTSPDGRYLLATIQNGDGGEFDHHLRGPDGSWKRLTNFADRFGVAVLDDDAIYMLARKGTPRGSIVRVPLAAPDIAKAATVVPQTDTAIDALTYTNQFGATFRATANGLYVLDSDGGPSRLRFVPRAGKDELVPLPPVCSVGGIVGVGGDDVLISIASFTQPQAWYRYDRKARTLTKTALARTSPVSFDDIEVAREFATSKDGTKVPISVLVRKGTKRDGTTPLVLTGYGGFGLSQKPGFGLGGRVWLEQGGALAIANLRGGGEYGEEWRSGGNLTRKQNVFDDFVAAAKHLIDRGYTSKDKLAIQGGSNGGLLVGAALTQHPELFRAVVAQVGLYDMLRFENHPNGSFNVPEYGSVKDAEQFRALHGYSPYHRVKDGTAYPAVLLMTGLNDGRVDPMHSWKMAARLQAATSSGRPVLMLTDAGSGHGLGDGLTTRIEKQADVYAFLFEQLGMTYMR